MRTIDPSPNPLLSPLLGGLILASSGALWGLAWDRLPEPIATHWGFEGPPDGASPKLPFVLGLAVAVLLCVALEATTRSTLKRTLCRALLLFVGSMTLLLSWSLISMNVDVAVWREVRALPFYHPLVVALVPLLIAGSYLAIQRVHSFGMPDTADSAPSSGTERVPNTWRGSAHNDWIPYLALPLFFSSLLTARWGPPSVTLLTALLSPLALFLVDLTSVIAVSIDSDGVRIRFGRLGWVRKNLPLKTIERAESFELSPLTYGGWGYRRPFFGPKGPAIVVRGGPALRLHLQGGKHFSMTVDDAARGAATLNQLIVQR